MRIEQTMEAPDRLVSRLYPDEGENIIRTFYFYHLTFRKELRLKGELIIPEGVEIIEKEALNHLMVDFKVIHLPKSLTRLGENMLSGYSAYKVFYAGDSETFQKIAAIREESVCATDGFDRAPYYSGNSAWVKICRCFDGIADSVEVYCEEDGVTLLYGTRHRASDAPPKIIPPDTKKD